MPFSGWYGMGFGFGSEPGAAGGLAEEDLELLILSVLEDEGPARGYQVALELEERSDGGIHPDPELVYPLLQLLVDREMLSVHDPEAEKQVYELTDQGRERVERRRLRIDALWRRARVGSREWQDDDEAFEAAMDSACRSIRSAMREVSRALDEVFDGVFGSCGGRRHSRRRHWHRGRGPGCC